MTNILLYSVLIVTAVMGYLFGSLNFAVIIGKLFYKTDVREYGSGNAGATNVKRTLGMKAAVLVTIGDFFKGMIAYFIAQAIGYRFGEPLLFACVCGFAAVLGHNFPIFFRFKGGKGILTSLGLSFAIDWRAAILTLLIAILIMAVTKYVSVGSVLGCVSNTILISLIDPNPLKIWFVALLTILAAVRHHANFKRLLAGTESKIGAKK